MVAQKPGAGDEPAGKPDGAETLVVEVVREPVAGQLRDGLGGGVGGVGGQRTEDDGEPVPPEVRGGIRLIEPADGDEVKAVLAQRAVGTVEDGQVLRSDGVAVLEPAVTDPTPGEIPAPADRLDGFERPDPALREPVEAEPPAPAAFDDGEFLDHEILGKSLEFHRPPMLPGSTPLRRARTHVGAAGDRLN